MNISAEMETKAKDIEEDIYVSGKTRSSGLEDEDSNMDKAGFSDSLKLSCFHVDEREEFEPDSIEVSEEKNEDHNEKKRSFLKHSKTGEFSNFQREGKTVKEHACMKKQEFSGNNGQISLHPLSKSNKDECEDRHEMQDLQEINEGVAENFCNHSSREEILTKRSESKGEDLPESPNSNQASLPKDLNEKDIGRLKLNDFSSIGTKKLKKVVSSMDTCNNEIDKKMKRAEHDLDKKSLRETEKTLSTKEEKFCVDEDKVRELRNVKANENCSLLHQPGVIGLKTRNEESDKTSFDLHNHASRKNHTENQEAIEKFEETDQPIFRRKHAYLLKENHLCKNMCDVVLGLKEGFGPEEYNEVKKPTKSESALPLKFRFEDDVPKPVEKSEYEIEMEGLFAEMAYCYTY